MHRCPPLLPGCSNEISCAWFGFSLCAVLHFAWLALNHLSVDLWWPLYNRNMGRCVKAEPFCRRHWKALLLTDQPTRYCMWDQSSKVCWLKGRNCKLLSSDAQKCRFYELKGWMEWVEDVAFPEGWLGIATKGFKDCPKMASRLLKKYRRTCLRF